MRSKCIAEFIGTFSVVFAGCGAVMIAARIPGSIHPATIPLIFGATVTVMIYALGHISGAHFNPAVTTAFAIARHFPVKQVVPYWLSQCLGALAAMLVLRAILPAGDVFAQTLPTIDVGPALVWEGILTFLLMFVITAVATDTRAVGMMAGAAIGGTVALGAYVGGPLTGASMNPARSLAPAVVAGDFASLWVYFVGPMVGAAVAALLYEQIRCETPSEKGETPSSAAITTSKSGELTSSGKSKDAKGCC